MSFKINQGVRHPVIDAMDCLMSEEEQIQAQKAAVMIAKICKEVERDEHGRLPDIVPTDSKVVIDGDPMCKDLTAVVKGQYKEKNTVIDVYRFICPHCLVAVEVDTRQVNCRIFRHGVYKHNLQPINPHAPKQLCDQLLKSGKILGCAGPLKFTKEGDSYKVGKCDYI